MSVPRIMANILAGIMFLTAGLVPSAGRAQAVDLELVLAIDSSTSVDDREFELQRQGLSQAFLHPDVIGAIRAAGDLGVAVSVVQWSGKNRQHTSVEWSLVRDRPSAAALSAKIATAARSIKGMTDIGSAVRYSIGTLENNSYRGQRLVIDVSGDGSGNAANAQAARNLAISRGIVINGLVIDNEDIDLGELAKIDLRAHYANYVIGGFGAFLMNATDFNDFRTAIRRKLVREITGPATADLSEKHLADMSSQAPRHLNEYGPAQRP